jgi:DHA2 family multidrug resistance protein
MERSGMSHMQALANLEYMVDAQAMTGSALYVFSISAMLFVFAAAIVWLVPRPKGPITGNSGAH